MCSKLTSKFFQQFRLASSVVNVRIGTSMESSTWPYALVLAGAGIGTGIGFNEEARPVIQADIRPKSLPKHRLSKFYEENSVLGAGGFGEVCLGRHKRSNTQVAIKKMKKDKTSEAQFRQEVDILRQVAGKQNIIELRDVFETTDEYVLVTEMAEGGELFDRLVNHGTYTEWNASKIIHETTQALKYLHSKSIVHADVKPENIVLTSKSDPTQMRLVDFGLAFRVGSRTQPAFADGTGTVAYSAPELLLGKNGNGKADMFSLGIVLYILLAGYHPFDELNNVSDDEIRRRIIGGIYHFNNPVWKNVSLEAKDLISKLLVTNPEHRLSAVEVLQHPWIRASQLSNINESDPSKAEDGKQKLLTSVAALLIDESSKDVDVREKSWLQAFENCNEEEVQTAIDKLDPTHKGYIDGNDLKRAMKVLGEDLPEADIQSMLAGDGSNNHIQYSDIARIIADLECKTFKKGDKIFEQGESSKDVYVVLDGKIDVTTDTNKLFVKVGQMKTGNVIGENCVAGQRVCTARCASPKCRVLVLQQDQLHQVKTEYCRFRKKLAQEQHGQLNSIVKEYIRNGTNAFPCEFKANEIICKENESCDNLYVIQSGSLEVVKEKENGDKVVVEKLQAGDFFPLGIVEGKMIRDATVVCSTDAELIKVDGECLRECLGKDAPVVHSVIQEEVDRRRVLRQRRAFRGFSRP